MQMLTLYKLALQLCLNVMILRVLKYVLKTMNMAFMFNGREPVIILYNQMKLLHWLNER